MNKVRSRGTGYTIVETMIFLAVSAALFLTAMLVVGGQQRKTEFSTAVRDFDSKLQSTINNVSSGYYNNPGSITCVVDPGPPRVPDVTNTASSQGQNEGCTFAGQWIELVPAGNSFTITSHAGLRLDDTGKEVTDLTTSRHVPIGSTAENYDLPYGITATMKIVGGSSIDTLAVTPTFNAYSSSTLSGSSRTEIHAINTPLSSDVTNPPNGVRICLAGADQVGIIIFNNSSTNVSIAKGPLAVACP